jgi:hypothetical protein
MAKLTARTVAAIRRALGAGVPKAVLARRYNVSTSAIYRIEKGLTWKVS